MMQLKKANLKPAPGEGGTEIKFMFNPTNLKFMRSVNWGGGKGKPAKPAEDPDMLPKSNFSGISPYTLTINGIIYDTYESRKSVWTEYIESLHKATLPSSKKDKNSKDKRPAIYIFSWGEPFYFRCVVKSLTFTYEMFLPDGTPVRAKVNLTLTEVDKVTDTYLGAQPDRKADTRASRLT
jgi:Contractile injection system tube protein